MTDCDCNLTNTFPKTSYGENGFQTTIKDNTETAFSNERHTGHGSHYI